MLALFNLLGGRTLMLAGVGIALVAGWLWLDHLLVDRAALQATNAAHVAELDRLQAIDDENQRTIQRQQADAAKALAAAAAERDRALQRLAALTALAKEIDNAPEKDRQRSVGSVLGAALDGLRRQRAAGAAGGAGPLPPPANPAEPAAVPARP
jgi:hypothetical protein